MSIAEKTAEAKKNKDGLIGGGLVSPQDHARVTREKKKAALKAIKDKAAK